jgi:ribosomal RNA-processing protein 36
MGKDKEPVMESEWQDEDSDLEPSEGELNVSSPELLETDEQGGEFATEDVDHQEEAGSNASGAEESESSVDGSSQKRKRQDTVKPAIAKPDLDTLRNEILGLLSSKSGAQALKQDEESSESSSEDEDGPARKKSKHAPATMSSKRTVSRKRNVIDLAKPVVRDPRFDATSGPVDHSKIRKRYAFLDNYVEDEIKSLKTALKQQKPKKVRTEEGKYKNAKRPKGVAKLPEEDIEAMKRELVKLESKRATQQARDREHEVQSEHKKKEMELVKQGKKAFFLKNSEVKKQVLVKRFEGMSQGRREKTMEKKRRKVAGKERKAMPGERRSFG